jgi:hypothetical protein
MLWVRTYNTGSMYHPAAERIVLFWQLGYAEWITGSTGGEMTIKGIGELGV